MTLGYCHTQGLASNSLQDQARLLYRKIQKADMNPSFTQRFNLQTRGHVLQLDADSRITSAQMHQGVDEDFIHAHGNADGKMSNFAFARLRCHTRKVIDLSEHLMRLADDSFTRSRQPDFALRPLKQTNAEFFLQLTNLLA